MSLNQSDKEFYDEKPTLEKDNFNKEFFNCLENRALGNYAKKNVNPLEFSAVAENVLVKKNHTEMRCEIPGIPRSTFLVVFSPDGTKMASTHGNHNIYVTDIRTGKNIKTLVGHPRTPWCIAFHPTSNQIIASGCLGGQVRIWDLSGGSEVWTTENQTVIASIAFHPDDRVLVIATYNELYFWDWSKPEPFMHVATNNVKEKVRYVAFDKLGHKLITGISNSPQARWERVRAPVPIPRQIDRTANTYRRRITPRLIFPHISSFQQTQQRNPPARQPLSSVPERERRITQCYRNLVHEYELLVHRFLQIYRPPTMIDQGTDPMEVEQTNNNNPTPTPTTANSEQQENPGPSTSNSSNPYSIPNPTVSRDRFSRYYQDFLNRREEARRFRSYTKYFNSAQTQYERSSDLSEPEQEIPENLTTTNRKVENANENETTNPATTSQNGTQTYSPCRILNLNRSNNNKNTPNSTEPSTSKQLNIKCTSKRKSSQPGTSSLLNVKKAKETNHDTLVFPSTSQGVRESEDRDRSPVLKWNRTVRKRVHSTNKYYVPSSDSSSSDEESIIKRRMFLTKKLSKIAQADSKKKKATNTNDTTTPPPSTSSTNAENNEEVRPSRRVDKICVERMRRFDHNNRFDTTNNPVPAASTESQPATSSLLQSSSLLSPHPSAFCPLRVTSPRSVSSQRITPTEEPLNLSAFHPFDPPPEFVSIHPENIGIGNMYSNIVQELESSLNDVRNIRANNRLGETSDMLSSFSERLESIMNQSNAILRNLHTSIDTILPESDNNNQETNERIPDSSRTHLVFNDNSFYVRERTDAEEDRTLYDPEEILTSNTAVASDHTYPRNPRATRNTSTTTMTPLIVSLHFTVSHIRRQARLLRQQVESIEHIDRAMLEVAQLQMMRQMFSEIHRYFRSISGNDRNIGMSSVRQMMAGTSISDSNQNANDNSQRSEPSTSNATHPSNSASRSRAHKSFPRCIFLMHRPYRRPNLRSMSRDRSTRRHIYRRSFSCRGMPRSPIDLTTRAFLSLFNPEALPIMTRRLERLLMEHGRFIGHVVEPHREETNEVAEHIVMLRLNDCRSRINRVLRDSNNNNSRLSTNCVTRDGAPRLIARQTLCSTLDTLSRFVEANAGNTLSANFRTHIWDVVELSLLLSEILLLQIVDSIPPPTGMNLDPERESLSARIDQMCTRMLQSRLSVQSHQLTRSLRLMRLTVRHAAQALGQTYTARRNAMLPSDTNVDRRRQLLHDINICLRNIRRHRNQTEPTENSNTESNALPIRNWYRTINELISRYTSSEENSGPNAPESDEQLEESSDNRQGVNNSSDSNDYNETDWYNNNIRRDSRTLYRSNHMNLLENSPNTTENTSPPNSYNIPTIQVNDYSEFYVPWRPASPTLSERFSGLRTHTTMGSFFRPRFLHPLHAVNNPFDADLDSNQREQMYDSDIITSVTPNHRIQIWEFDLRTIPNINNSMKNIVVSECKIHNDASVDIASDGSMLVTLLPGGYLNVTNKLGVYSLDWKTLGQCLYIATFEQNAISVSLSPINKYLLVGLASRRVIMQNDKWTMARVFLLDKKATTVCGRLLSVRELEQTRDANYTSVNCIRWLPVSGQGLVYATNTGKLKILT